MEGTTVLGTGTIDANGHSSLTISTLGLGTHNIIASYAGDGHFAQSSSTPLSVKVVALTLTPTAVSWVGPVSTAVLHQPVTLTVDVAPAKGPGAPSGKVTFMEGTTVLGTGIIDANGHASLTISTLGLGTHNIIASYAGDSHFATSSSAPLSVKVVAPTLTPTAVTWVGPVSTAVLHQPVTLTVDVAPAKGPGAPSGKVTFMEGTTVLGMGTIDAHGHASLAISTLAVGTHDIIATYAGDSTFASSASTALALKITPAPGK
jgi:hypothetical protein